MTWILSFMEQHWDEPMYQSLATWEDREISFVVFGLRGNVVFSIFQLIEPVGVT